MNKLLVARLTLFALAFSVIFLAGCKKNGTSPKPPITIAPPAQQNKIVYLDYLNGPNTYTLWTANYDGSGAQQINIAMPTKIKLGGGLPKISLDDKNIYFNGVSTVNNVSSIYSCDMNGNNVNLLVAGGNDGQAEISGTYYANQQGKILYGMIVNYAEYLWSANSDGSDQQQINVTLPVNAYVPASSLLVPSPDGKTIFFRLALANGNYFIYSCGVDGSKLTPVINDPSGYSYFIGAAFIVGQQSKIVYMNYKGSGQIMIANSDGSGAQAVSYTLPYPAATNVNPPAMSPDGKTIFFNTTGLNGNEYGVYSCNIDGSNLKQILTPPTRYDSYVIGQAF
jgi:hypothetical protein